MSQAEKEATTVDVREVLITFWLSALYNQNAEFGDRVKASELLAKYILGSPSGSRVPKKQTTKPSTADILKLATQIENNQNGKQGSPESS